MRRGVLQYQGERGIWIDPSFNHDRDPLPAFIESWLWRDIIRRPYRWVEGGRAVYLPRCDGGLAYIQKLHR